MDKRSYSTNRMRRGTNIRYDFRMTDHTKDFETACEEIANWIERQANEFFPDWYLEEFGGR